MSIAPTVTEPCSRPLPTAPRDLGRTVLGGERPVICIPLISTGLEALREEIRSVLEIGPDLVEVRADFWDCIEDTGEAVAMLRAARNCLGDMPILLTVRVPEEGGHKGVSEEAKFALYNAAVQEKLAELVDVELVYGEEKIGALKKCLAGTGIGLVVAFHDMRGTPSAAEIVELLEREVTFGADVVKIVVKAHNEEDVLQLLGGTLAFRRKNPEFPVIASGSGAAGRVTRLIGGLFGIDLTFAAGVHISNPTHMPVPVVRDAFNLIFPEKNSD